MNKPTLPSKTFSLKKYSGCPISRKLIQNSESHLFKTALYLCCITCLIFAKNISAQGPSAYRDISSPPKKEKKLHVITSTMNLHSLAKSVGGEQILLESLTKGPQDPHFQEPRPSYMLKLKKADLLISVGMDLEVGWLNSIIQGSRNPSIQKGKKGHLEAGQFIQALSIPKGKVDRFFGDVHPFGNPHYLLDPSRAIEVSKAIRRKLSELDSKNKNHYEKNQKHFEAGLKKKMKEWKKRVQNSNIKTVVTYHSSFEYFLNRFQLKLLGTIEEKPGIPPSAKHILKLVQKMKDNQSFCILMSSFYSSKWAKKMKKAIPLHVEKTAIEVSALPSAKNYTLVIENLVQALEACGKFKAQQSMGAKV